MSEIDELDNFANDVQIVVRKLGNGTPLTAEDRSVVVKIVSRNIPLFREDDEAFEPCANISATGRVGRFTFGVLGNGTSVIAPFIDNLKLGFSDAPTAAARIAEFFGTGSDRSGQLSNAGQTLADDIADIFRTTTNTDLEQDQAEELVFIAEPSGLNTNNGSVRQGLTQSAASTMRIAENIVSSNLTGAAAITLVTAEKTLAYGHPFFEKIGICGAIRYL